MSRGQRTWGGSGRGSLRWGAECVCVKTPYTHDLLRGEKEKKALICNTTAAQKLRGGAGAAALPHPLSAGGAPAPRGAALGPHWLRAATCRPRRAPAPLPAAGPRRARASERRGRRAPPAPPAAPQRGRRRPRPMRRRRACGLRPEQSAGCAPPPAPELPGLSLPSRQGAAGMGRCGLRVLQEMGGGRRFCLGLEGEGVLAAAGLSCSSGIKFIGFCFSAGSDRRFVRDSVFHAWSDVNANQIRLLLLLPKPFCLLQRRSRKRVSFFPALCWDFFFNLFFLFQ